MPPERLNGGAIRGSLPTVRNDTGDGYSFTPSFLHSFIPSFHSKTAAGAAAVLLFLQVL